MNYPGQKWFHCDSWGFVSGLKDVGLQKDQADDVLDEPGLIVLSINKHSRRNSVTVQTSDCIMQKQNSYLIDR